MLRKCDLKARVFLLCKIKQAWDGAGAGGGSPCPLRGTAFLLEGSHLSPLAVCPSLENPASREDTQQIGKGARVLGRGGGGGEWGE